MAALSFVEWEVVTCLILVMCKMGIIIVPGSPRGLWETEDISVIHVPPVHVKWGVASQINWFLPDGDDTWFS